MSVNIACSALTLSDWSGFFLKLSKFTRNSSFRSSCFFVRAKNYQWHRNNICIFVIKKFFLLACLSYRMKILLLQMDSTMHRNKPSLNKAENFFGFIWIQEVFTINNISKNINFIIFFIVFSPFINKNSLINTTD